MEEIFDILAKREVADVPPAVYSRLQHKINARRRYSARWLKAAAAAALLVWCAQATTFVALSSERYQYIEADVEIDDYSHSILESNYNSLYHE